MIDQTLIVIFVTMIVSLVEITSPSILTKILITVTVWRKATFRGI